MEKAKEVTFNGGRIRERREALQWSLRDMQMEWYVKYRESISFQTLSNWETGENQPSYRNLARLARLLGCHEGYFFA